MPSYVTPKKNTEYIFYIGLKDQTDTRLFKSNPTIAAGDFKVATDGGTLNNLTTIPAVTPASSKMVKITLSAAEMNGDNVTVVGSDAAGTEWCDVLVNIQTSARQVDDLAFPTTAGRSLDVTAGGTAGIDWANVEAPATAVGLSGTTVGTVTTLTGHTPQTGDSFARLGAPVGASISADLAAVEAQTDDIGAAGAGLTAVPWNPAWDAEAESEANDALVAYDPPTRAEATADVNSILTKVLKYVSLLARKDAAVAADYATELAAINVNAGSGAGAYANTTDALEALRDHTPTVGDITTPTLAKFVTVDTGEVAAATGSVAKLAQGAAGGNVTVGDLTTAALAKFATQDTGQTTAVGGSVAQLSRGTPTAVVGPVTVSVDAANRVQSPITLEMFQESAKTFALTVVDEDGAEIDLTGLTLRFVVHDKLDPTAGVFDVEAAGISISGATASVTVPTAASVVANVGEHAWKLWDVTATEVLAHGAFVIAPAKLNV